MKIALVHDYLAQDGGAERVLKAFHELWPDAPIFVWFHKKGSVEGFDNAKIYQSFISKLPFGKSHYRWYLPLLPLATEKYKLNSFDVVLSSTSAFAKGIITSSQTLHISYCHTPTRYLWTDTHQYISDLPNNKLVKLALPPLLHRLRMWDRASVDRVDHFIANSHTVRQRIKKFYRRESDIIHPPVDVHQFSIGKTEEYFVSGGRLVPYKRFDLLVQVFNRLGWPLKIYGTGPELEPLMKMAKDNIQFLGRVSEVQKAELLSHARAFLHPQVEDLGITPIEAMASGIPVIAYGVGGVMETVIPGKTGVFFHDQTWETLLDTLLRFDHTIWNKDEIRAHAQRFAAEQFKTSVKRYVEKRYEEFRQGIEQYRVPMSTNHESWNLDRGERIEEKRS